MAPDTGGDGCVAPGLEKRSQALLNLLGIRLDADYLAFVGNAENDDAALSISERARRLAYVGQIETALELRISVFLCLDTSQDVQPLHYCKSNS